MFPDKEAAAAGLLRKTATKTIPIDLASVAKAWPELTISFDEIEGEGYLVDLGARGAEIVVKKESDPARQRYTIAHELGHWTLRQTGVPGNEHAVESSSVVEKWCDSFAAALLMPEVAIKTQFRETPAKNWIDLLLAGPQAYGVSTQAFRLRISEVLGFTVLLLRESTSGINVEQDYSPRNGTAEISIPSLVRRMVAAKPISGEWVDQSGYRWTYRRLPKRATSRWLLCCIPPAPAVNSTGTDARHDIEQAPELSTRGNLPDPDNIQFQDQWRVLRFGAESDAFVAWVVGFLLGLHRSPTAKCANDLESKLGQKVGVIVATRHENSFVVKTRDLRVTADLTVLCILPPVDSVSGSSADVNRWRFYLLDAVQVAQLANSTSSTVRPIGYGKALSYSDLQASVARLLCENPVSSKASDKSTWLSAGYARST